MLIITANDPMLAAKLVEVKNKQNLQSMLSLAKVAIFFIIVAYLLLNRLLWIVIAEEPQFLFYINHTDANTLLITEATITSTCCIHLLEKSTVSSLFI